jgi:hypothetical protein
MPIFKSDNEEDIIVLCECGSVQHMLHVQFFDDENFEHVLFSLEVHLAAWQSLFRRLWEAVKYVLGCKHSCWDDMLFDVPTAAALRDYLSRCIDKASEDEHGEA